MYLRLCFCLLVLACFASCGKPSLSDPLGLYEESSQFQFGTGMDYVHGSLWPKPQQQAREETYFSLDSAGFQFRSTGKKSDVLDEALKRYTSLTFPDTMHSDPAFQIVASLEVNVLYDIKEMDLSTDESYTLVIDAPVSSLSANTPWGALRGLETFSQAVYQNETGYYHVQKNKIVDFPRFHHRGFLIDTSRHYVTVDIILKFIDALAYSKFNVLHWHIVDDPSFPFVSESFPSLHMKGAWNNVTHVYSPDDVQNVISYARFRGVRVIPEFDTPGHTQSWYSIPNLLTPCYSGGKPNGNFGPINPIVESNYVFLKSFFEEVSHVFPDTYIHLGGDEVSFSCWQSNPDISKWMADHGMGKNYSKLEEYYEQRLLDIVAGLGKNYVIWQEVIDNKVKVKSNTVVNVWKGNWPNEMATVTALGYRAILSSCWYLNYIAYGRDWPNYYNCDPQDFTGTQAQKDLVIGGTACMWGEWVDGTNLLARTWARGLSIGERLWSAKDVKDLNDATKRIWEHRCRYLRRGIQAENVVQSQYCRHEWMNKK